MKPKKILFLLAIATIGLTSSCRKAGFCQHHHGNCKGHHQQQNSSSAPSLNMR